MKNAHMESSVVSSGFPTPPSGVNGSGGVMMQNRQKTGQINKACDEIETVAPTPRTKL